MAIGPAAVLVFVSGFLCAQAASEQAAKDPPASAKELIREVIANEIKAEKADHSHWAFQLQTEKAGKSEIDQLVETKDGNLQMPISINGTPLTAKQKQQANQRLQNFIHNPSALRRSLRDENEDVTRSQNMLKLLPDAFNFSYEEKSSGKLVKLKFTPNPRFRPPSREAQVFHAMEGEITVNREQLRLVEISGQLVHEVKFGAGLLGQLDKGGQFYVKQEQVAPGFWEMTALNVQMRGKALFFKTIGVRQKIVRSGLHRVSDDLTLAQAADMLKK
jgi:hypothetical protein